MQTKFISKKKTEELQSMCDDYSRKSGRNTFFKILAVLLVVGMGASAPIIIGYSMKKNNPTTGPGTTKPESGQEETINFNDPAYKHEMLSPQAKKDFENGLTKYLCEQTGLAINLATTESVQLSCDEKGNFLIMESSIVTEEGTKDCTLVFSISPEQAKVVNDHILMHNFSLSFPAELEALLTDETTTLVSVFDNEQNLPLYAAGAAAKENPKR